MSNSKIFCNYIEFSIRSDSEWIADVGSARCDSDKLTYSKKGDAAIFVANNPKVKCVRMSENLYTLTVLNFSLRMHVLRKSL